MLPKLNFTNIAENTGYSTINSSISIGTCKIIYVPEKLYLLLNEHKDNRFSSHPRTII